jgi:hypothetical protein
MSQAPVSASNPGDDRMGHDLHPTLKRLLLRETPDFAT